MRVKLRWTFACSIRQHQGSCRLHFRGLVLKAARTAARAMQCMCHDLLSVSDYLCSPYCKPVARLMHVNTISIYE